MLKLVLGTLFGILFFIVPFKLNGEIVIVYSLVSHWIVEHVKFFPAIVAFGTVVSAIGAVIFTYLVKNVSSDFIKEAFVVTPMNMLMRVAAAAVGICVYFKIGHEFIWGEYTGGLIVNELMPSLYALFFFAFVFIPLLLEYGSMELFGIIAKPIFKPLFRLPGMSAILAVGSWVGSGTVGILSINMEYKNKKFTAREASILIFGFCTISLPASFIYTTEIGGLEVATFPFFYLTLLVCMVVSTMIISRIPPISRIPDDYYAGKVEKGGQVDESSVTENSMGLEAALAKAEAAPGLSKMVKNGTKNAMFMYLEAFPIIILIATLALIANEHTPLFKIIAMPFTPVLEAIGLPEAAAAAPNFVVGFADLLLPFLGATAITSQLTKFVICIVGLIQIICMSETGALVLKTDLPVNTWQMALIVFMKTVISIPIALVMGRMIGLT